MRKDDFSVSGGIRRVPGAVPLTQSIIAGVPDEQRMGGSACGSVS
jgi:hypothetical protein